MRRIFLLAPLATLAFASCDQQEGDAPPRGRTTQAPSAQTGTMLPGNSANPERIAAEDSMGKAPPPINLVAGRSDVCPVHRERMAVHEVPVVFEDARSGGGGASPSTTAFPFAAEEIVSPGTSLLPAESRTALVFRCAKCVAAKRTAAAEATRVVPSKGSE